MKLLTQSEFARQLKITRQAVHDAKKKGLLDIIKKGKREYVNIDGYKTVQYIKNDNSQRKFPDKNTAYKKQKKTGKNKDKETKIIIEEKNNLDIKDLNTIDLNIKDSDTIDLAYRRARAAAKIEEVQKRKLENAYKRGELVSREKVYDYIMFFLDRVFRGLELMGNTFLSDTAHKIITAGKITPAVRKRWTDEMLSKIDNAKKQVIKHIKTIEKEQAK